MVMFRAGFSRNLAPGFRKVIFNAYKERPVEGTKLVNMNTSKRAYEEDFEIGGFGTLQPKVEGGPIVYQDIPTGTPKRYVWTTFALGFRITQEMMEDDLYSVFGNRMSKALGRSARNNQEIVMHSVFNNAFDTSFVGFKAGESLIGSHTGLRGLVQQNSPATPADLSLPALQAALEHFHNLQDDSGIPAVFTPKTVVHSIGDYWIVNQLLKSQFLPGGNQNDINQLARESLTPHLSHYLTDPDAWFVVSDQTDINYFERRAFTVSNMDDFETGDAKFKGTRRNGAGYGGWRGIYGSQGV
jgi:hypothetical protein